VREVRGTEPATLAFENARAFGHWLKRNYAKAPGLWVKIAKAASGITSITYPEAVEEALCWGWIDGPMHRVDDRWYVQKFTPRTKRSLWSKLNRARVQSLIETGRMQSPGLAEIERAKQDGRWDRAYDSPKTAGVPADLAAALQKSKRAARFFQTLDAQNRYAILHRVQTAPKPDTRARRIAELVKMLQEGKKIHRKRT
jgi:uncharacterized protein YdeI (YjbR/CyaY-like superfamily)